jgi:sulfur-oxidizing protein SoxY
MFCDMTPIHDAISPTRRRFLTEGAAAAGCLGLGVAITVKPASATPDTMKAAIRRVIGEAAVQTGKVKFDVPPLVENGNVVPVTITVDSPMNATEYVKAIHLFNEKNPQPNVVGVKLGPRAGRASLSTRIRLADSQTIVAIAELSDGTFWTDNVQVIVTLAACVEGL